MKMDTFWTRKQVLNESSLLVIRYFTLLISIQFHFLLHKNMFYDKEKRIHFEKRLIKIDSRVSHIKLFFIQGFNLRLPKNFLNQYFIKFHEGF